MRAVSANWAAGIATSHRVITTVEAWYDGVALRDIPILAGTITYDDTATLRRRVAFEAPARDDQGVSLVPGTNPLAPLACYGQQVNIRTGIAYPDGTTELLNQGWYLITDWRVSQAGQRIQVQACDLRQLIDDAKFFSPQANLGAASSYYTEFQRLIQQWDGIAKAIKVAPLPAELRDRALPDTVWDRERGGALDTLATAWPARWYIDDDATATLAAPYPDVLGDAVATLHDLGSGTVVDRTSSGSRSRISNAVIVTGAAPASGGGTPWSGKVIDFPGAVLNASGPFGPKARFFSTPILDTYDACDNAAETLMLKVQAQGRTEDASVVPDPSLELGDVVNVVTAERGTFKGRVQSISLPLTARQGAMGITVTNTPSGA